MATRRAFLTRLLTLGLGGGAVWAAREAIVWPSPHAALPEGAATSGWLPFADRSNSILSAPLSLAGRTVTALVDSGAQLSVVDKALAEALNLGGWSFPVLAFGLNGAPQLGFSARLALQAGDLSLTGLNAAQLDLARLPVPRSARFDMILGQNALAALVLDIDFPRRRMAFSLPDGFVPPKGAVAVPARLEGRRLLTQVSVDGRPIEVVLDTGASAVLALSSEAARKAGLLDGAGGGAQAGQTVTLGGLSDARVATARTMRFSDATYSDVPVQIFDSAGGLMLPQGLLGLGALRAFRVILNLGRGQVWMLPSQAPTGADAA